MNLKHKIIVTDISDLVIRASPTINLSISKNDCSLALYAVGISRDDYKRIEMAMDSLDTCSRGYEQRIEEYNRIVSAEWRKQQEDKKITKVTSESSRPRILENVGKYGFDYQRFNDGYIILDRFGDPIPPQELMKMLGRLIILPE